jgi:AcrR family transcriptional regulator
VDAERETLLERAVEEASPPALTPLDVLEAARRMWLQNGRLDMGALAAEVGLSRATLYRWVGSRERLLGEVAWTFARAAWDDALARAAGKGADRIANAVDRYLRGSLAFPPVRRFIESDPEMALRVLASQHSPVQKRSIAAMRDLLAEEAGKGAYEPALDIDALAFLIVRIAESFMFSDLITGREPDVDHACDAIHILLHAPPVKRPRRR